MLFGNASSNHEYGKIAKQAIEKARFQCAEIINSNPDEIIFTSGSTESINLGIKGYLESNTEKGNHIITVRTEHKAVLATCEYLETKGYEVTYLDVDENGLISLSELRETVKENTLLIVIMYVNNETGVIQPINEIGKIARENDVAFYCDATQAVGKIKVDIEKDLIDMLCFSGHKLNGPKGIGVLYKKNDIELTPLIHGGGQENGLRGGTYNTPSIVGFGKACEIAHQDMNKNINKVKNLNEHLVNSLEKITPFIEVSKKHLRVPNILNIIIPNLMSDIFIDKYSEVAVSNGSACNSSIMEESHVIKSMMQKKQYENKYLRISLDHFSTEEQIDIFIEVLNKHLNNA
tara:strand:+ start:8 stop:1051 length:1044 start_codon:yes stop_codon:yes gene_type:complete